MLLAQRVVIASAVKNGMEIIMDLFARVCSFVFVASAMPLIFTLGCLGFMWVSMINVWETIT